MRIKQNELKKKIIIPDAREQKTITSPLKSTVAELLQEYNIKYRRLDK